MLERRLAQFAILAAGAVFAVCVAVIAGGGLRRPDTRIAQLGSVAPEIAFRDVNNQDLKLSRLRGSFVLVYFTPDPADALKSLLPADSSDAETASTLNDASVAKFKQLKQLGDALNAKQVTVLEGDLSPSSQPMNLLGVSVDPSTINASRYSRTLLDSDGEIARNYRVDAIAAQPTLFVIDDRGVIRYRGNVADGLAGNLVHKLACDRTGGPSTPAELATVPLSAEKLSNAYGPLAALGHF